MNNIYVIPIALITLLAIGSCTADRQPAHSSLSVMSFNIRYDNPGDGVNSWDNRKQRVANLISFYQPTFIGTQEGLHHQLTYLEENLSNYGWIGVGRDSGDMEGEFSALFYDSTNVDLISGSENTIWLSQTPGEPSKSWDAALPRILTYAQFRSQSTGQQFWVFNTHFDHVGDTARAKSAELILNRINQVAGSEPVVLTGDFNVTPDSRPYSIITNSSNGLADAFEGSSLPHVGPLFTYEGFEVDTENDGRRIDYIFTNQAVQVQKHAIIPSFRENRYPSDHLPVYAKFTISK